VNLREKAMTKRNSETLERVWSREGNGEVLGGFCPEIGFDRNWNWLLRGFKGGSGIWWSGEK